MIYRDPASNQPDPGGSDNGAYVSLLVGLSAGAVLAALLAMALRCFG